MGVSFQADHGRTAFRALTVWLYVCTLGSRKLEHLFGSLTLLCVHALVCRVRSPGGLQVRKGVRLVSVPRGI